MESRKPAEGHVNGCRGSPDGEDIAPWDGLFGDIWTDSREETDRADPDTRVEGSKDGHAPAPQPGERADYTMMVDCGSPSSPTRTACALAEMCVESGSCDGSVNVQ